VTLPKVLSGQTQFTFGAWIYAQSGARYFISEWANNQGAFLQVAGDNYIQFYINGIMLGLTKREITSRFDEEAVSKGDDCLPTLCEPWQGDGERAAHAHGHCVLDDLLDAQRRAVVQLERADIGEVRVGLRARPVEDVAHQPGGPGVDLGEGGDADLGGHLCDSMAHQAGTQYCDFLVSAICFHLCKMLRST
jgi:hypothetical protein